MLILIKNQVRWFMMINIRYVRMHANMTIIMMRIDI